MRTVLLLGVLALAWGAAQPAAAAQRYDEARRAYEQLQEDGPTARTPGPWRAAADRFRRVAAELPAFPQADQALYTAGICLERANAVSGEARDLTQALETYEGLVRSYPGSPLAPDALLRAGRVLELRGDPEGAGARYRRLLAQYPHSDVAGAAGRRLERLGRESTVQGVRFFTGPDYTRVVVDLNEPAAFAARSLPVDPAADRPHRVYLDLAASRLAPTCEAGYAVSDGLVRQVRLAQYDPRTVRVVLDLDAPPRFRAFPLEAPARIVVDVFRGPAPGDPVAALIPGRPPRPLPRRPRLVIDPGHGGKDPGAIGVGGLREKDVTLGIARELAQLLRRQGTWEVRLTRDRDVTLSLEERTAIANAFGADLFLSIHANASPNPHARGVETYYLSPASDRASRRLAARENAAGEEAAAEMEHILADVVLHSKVRDSRRLAEAVQRELVAHAPGPRGTARDLGVKRGPFYVLAGAFMPAVLVEVAFVSNPEEARWLRDEGFRRRTAEALAQGVSAFVPGS
ncbi:MAG: N-acetylmuramoyl-L-alanine amidase [Deferrisomatales bacterium]